MEQNVILTLHSGVKDLIFISLQIVPNLSLLHVYSEHKCFLEIYLESENSLSFMMPLCWQDCNNVSNK